MGDPLGQLATLHSLLTQGLRSTADLRKAASVCQNLVIPEIDGGGAFMLFAYYFVSLANAREGNAVDADKYERGMDLIISLIQECLQAIEDYDPIRLHATLDSFARTAHRLQLP